MLSKPRIKLINSLGMGKFRKQHGLFVAEGATNVVDFIQSGSETDEILATAEWIENNKQIAKEHAVTMVDEKEMKKISFLKHPSEILGIFKIPVYEAIDLNSLTDLVLMLDDVRDPGNLGTIIRTADWFGIKNIICSKGSVDAYNPKVVQASMGSMARVRLYYEDLPQLLKSKPDYLKVFATVLNGDNIIEIPKPQSGIILIGNEAHGISDELIGMVDHKITIPSMNDSGEATAESLNVSIATAIVCYEFRR